MLFLDPDGFPDTITRTSQICCLVQQQMNKTKNQKIDIEKDDLDLTPEEIRKIKKIARDVENPVRYVIYSEIPPGGQWKMFLNASDYTFCEDIFTATLFRTERMAKALAEACSGEKVMNLLVAKITTKSGKRKILKYEKH
jgi:hypothetical protein